MAKGAVVTPIISLLKGDEKEAIKNILLLDSEEQDSFRNFALKLCKLATMTNHELRGELDTDDLAVLESSQKATSGPSEAQEAPQNCVGPPHSDS